MWPLVHQAAPFDVGFTNEFPEKLIRREDATATSSQSDKRFIDAVEQHRASLQLAVKDALQSSRIIAHVATDPRRDFDFGLSLS
jgi:hypothetical protein